MLPALFIAIPFAVALPLGARAESPPGPPARLALQPDIHGELIAFVHGEDIWTVPAAGGIAKRITFHEGEERFPKFSPDGKRIAFTGEYDGNADVYVMNVEGGEISRVTYHPGSDEVVGWHPTSGKILFRSTRDAYSRFTRLHLIAPDGTGLEALPLPEAGWGSFSADGSRMAYTRVATEDRSWKRYRGGLAPDLYLYDFKTGKDRKLTDGRGTERFPMWIGDKIYFQADPDGLLNIWVLDPETGEQKQLTRYSDFEAGRPSDGGGLIVYDRAGRLEIFDPGAGKARAVPIEILAEAPEARPYVRSVKDLVTQIGVSPDGSRALVVARGEIFSVPREKGITRNLSQDAGSRDKDAVWSPDGKQIAFFSDRSGEYDLWLTDPLVKEKPVRLTTHADGYRHGLRWSPDSKRIAFSDQTLTLWTVDVGSRQIVKVDKADREAMDLGIDAKPICDHVWSGDSRFIAYSKLGPDLVSRIHIYSLETKESRPVTGGLVDSFAPVFSEDGLRLFFAGNRRFEPTYCDMDFELVYKKVAGMYAIALRKDSPALLPPETGDDAKPEDKAEDKAGEKTGDKAGNKPEAGKEDKPGKTEPARVAIDFEDIEGRVEPLPLPRGNYRRLGFAKGALFFLDCDEGDFNRFDIREPGPRKLQAFDVAKRKARTLLEAVDDYRISADGSRIAWRRGDEVGIVDSSAENAKQEPLDLSGLTMKLDPRAEWKQIYREVWRLERDFFYDPDMHGLDWKAVGKKYEPLIDAASSRAEVRWVIGQLIGELATSHTYVSGGDRRRRADRVSVGMLAADWEADPAAGRWRIRRILRAPDWNDGRLPPLAVPGVDAREGDYLLAVDGREVTAEREVYAAFEGLAGRAVKLTLSDKPQPGSAREALVVPTGDEGRFRYLDWVERNRRTVDLASDGRIGYMHLPDTFTGSAAMFPHYWYGQTQKKGIVIDGRFNGGGLDPDPFLKRLEAPILFYWTRRQSQDYSTPLVATRAHMALLTNRQAGSGGDMLPAEFRLRKMGPIIGTRTWGGLVGISMFVSLVDGGSITAPDYRVYSTDGKWIIENEGVDPDIPVDIDPAEMARGHDAQLMTAVDYLKKKIAEEPRPAPPRPPSAR
jgi:tricorn protease